MMKRFDEKRVLVTGAATGLGLAIARTLFESQNGEICVSSHANQGTTFKVKLQCIED